MTNTIDAALLMLWTSSLRPRVQERA